ncbi:hypothetical protein ACQRIT_001843 [Beauveria bassiana]
MEEVVAEVSLLATYKTVVARSWALLFDPISALCAAYMGLVFLLQFMLFSVYSILFHEIRRWSTTNAQLPLLGAVVGAVIARHFHPLRHTASKSSLWETGATWSPKTTLRSAKIRGIGFPICMFWLAWTGQYVSVHWIIPTIAGIFLYASLMLVFLVIVNYIVQGYGQYSASIIAGNTFARSLGSASAQLFTTAMFHAMGVDGGGSLVAGVATLLSVYPFVFSRYGKFIRARSKYTAFCVAKPYNEDPGGEEHPTSCNDADLQQHQSNH